MTTLSERVNAALEAAGFDQSELARKIGLTSVAVNGWCTGATKSLKGENLLKAADALGVNATWLSSGKGEMNPAGMGPAIQTPLRPVRLLGESDQVPEEVISIPRYTLRASAGLGAPVLEVDKKGIPNFCRKTWALGHGYKPENLFTIVAIGDSMEPTIPDGSSLIVHKQDEILNGKPHVICRGNDCYVKRLYKQMDGTVLIHSDNDKAYKDAIAGPNDPDVLHVVGLVVNVSFSPL